MGIRDFKLSFSEAQAITATAYSDNSLDMLQGNTSIIRPRDIAPGNSVYWYVFIAEAFNTLTSLNFELFTNDTDSFVGSEELVHNFDIPLAELIASAYPVNARLPDGRGKEFYKIRYSVVGTDPTLGQVTSGFSIAGVGVDPKDI